MGYKAKRAMYPRFTISAIRCRLTFKNFGKIHILPSFRKSILIEYLSHCYHRTVHHCRYILRPRSAKTELLYPPDCSLLPSVHWVVFSLKTGNRISAAFIL